MTSIVIAPRVEDLTSDTEAVASGGWFRIRPARAYKAGGQWVHPVWPASVTPLNGAAVTVKLDPIADVPYELELSIPDGNGGAYNPPNEFRYVTASASPLNWEDLIQEAGPGVGAPLPGSAEARLLALETLYSTLTGGASTLAGITDMTAAARTLNTKTSTGAMLTYLNAPAIGDAPTAHTHAVPGGLVATGTASNTTFLRGDGAWATPPAAGSPAWVDVTGKPTTFPPTLPIASSGVTGLDTSLSSLGTRVSAVETTLPAQISKTMAKVQQVGSLYPTPLPTGFYGIRFQGQLDPADQAGITVQNTDEWVQLP